jgi:hypothetical protein
VFPSISGDGRYVVFDSNASNLVASDVNGAQADIFVRDLTTGVTTLVSRSSLGIQGNADSVQSSITPDGRYVCFTSIATNLVANDNNGTNDAFLRDLWTGTTELVAKNAQGAQGNLGTGLNYGSRSLTPDARFVAARSHCTNLVPGVSHSGVPHQIYVFDRQAGVAAAPNPWTCLGGGLTGAFGVPLLTATGIPGPGATITLGVNNASPSSVVTFIVGLTQADAPFFGGILVPSQDFTLAASADANGTTVQLFEWPPGLASGAPLYFQATVAPDPAAPQGVALSNAVKGIQP